MKTLLVSLDLKELVDEGYDKANANPMATQIKELKKTKQELLQLCQRSNKPSPIRFSLESWELKNQIRHVRIFKKNLEEMKSGGQQNRSGTYGHGRGQEKTKHGGRGFYKAENGKKCTQCGKSNHEYKDCWFKDKPKCHKCDESFFVSIDTSVNSQVKMGNGALVKARGKRTISVDTKKGMKCISDALLVPNLRQNLLSVGQLIEHRYIVHFEGNSCVILDKEGAKHIMAKIQMEKSRSFPLTFKYAENMAMKAQSFWVICYAQISKEKRKKLDETSVKCILVGYNNMSKGYRLYNLKTRSVITSRDVIFDENASWNWEVNEVRKNGSIIDETKQVSIVEDEGDGDEGADFSSPNESSPNTDPSPSTSSSSPAPRMKSLQNVYERCNIHEQSESTLSWCNKERVLRYIKDLTNFGIKYVKGAQVNLQGYCDSDWAGCLDDMKSTTGHSFSLGSSVFSWTSKKQESVAQSTAEAGYVAAAMATSHVYWLRKILGDIGMK
ncbi:hypothetical protein SASPL_126886 [Salvia splendens]|uniref:CCHC-type domain-containing protein n=1 Tax=Salvia splendens TaxID=180675 RepID=A0A8X8XLM4_SALSN|nr:hypothetical protein SASPL_126886 [Salvia splendens]